MNKLYWLGLTATGLGILVVAFLQIAPPIAEKSMNMVITHAPYAITSEAEALHKTLVIGDMHSDALLWNRNLLKRYNYGHVDIPRMIEGNQTLQVFATVTKSPKGLNYETNAADAPDNITVLALAEAWPPRTWDNLYERARYQGQRLARLEKNSKGGFIMIRTRQDLQTLLDRRRSGDNVVGGLLSFEGAHCLEGDIDNINRLFEAGFRMMSLHHFFDNRLGGSLHGTGKTGLTEFGRSVVRAITACNIVLDVSHSSPEVVREVLELTNKPFVVSHTGVYGHHPGPRNLPDELMQKIAAQGGLIGIGYWDGAIGKDLSPANVVAAIRYAIDLVGIDHVALGSDFDGTVTTTFDCSELAVLTEEMLQAGFTDNEIRKVMGENLVDLLMAQLPG